MRRQYFCTLAEIACLANLRTSLFILAAQMDSWGNVCLGPFHRVRCHWSKR